MSVEPTKGPSGGEQQPERAPRGKPPGQEFKKSMEGVGRRGEKPEGKKEPPQKKPKTPFDVKKEKAKEAALAAVNQQQQQKEGAVMFSADVKATGFGSAVDKIISIFQNNAIYGSQINQLQVSVKGAETSITVLLQNGVQVDINLTGGQDLNIQIQGLTEAAQNALDNAAHQQMLRERLAEQGFTIHQIQTFRGEGPAMMGAPLPPPPIATAPTAGEQPFYGGEREGEGGGGGREGGEEGEEEQG